MAPTVSINLCCYNSEKYLRETLDSIVNQTYKDWELIIINDGSSDSTESIILDFKNQGYPIIYQFQQNKGLGASRNEALNLSSGEFIAFIDHDDIWLPRKLEKQIALFADEEVGLVFSDAIYFYINGNTKNVKRFYANKTYRTGRCFSTLLTDYFLCMQTVVIRRSALDEEEEWFDPRFQIIEEADLFRRVAHKWSLAMVDEPLAKWRVHKESSTWTMGYLVANETVKMLKKYDQIFPGFSNKFSQEISILEQKSHIYTAKHYWRLGNGGAARNHLQQYLFKSKKAFFVFLATFLPFNCVKPIAKYLISTGVFPD